MFTFDEACLANHLIYLGNNKQIQFRICYPNTILIEQNLPIKTGPNISVVIFQILILWMSGWRSGSGPEDPQDFSGFVSVKNMVPELRFNIVCFFKFIFMIGIHQNGKSDPEPSE